MHSISSKIVIFLFVITSVSLIFPLQTIYSQTPNNSTQSVTASSQLQWKVYVNDENGFSIEYPMSWIIDERQNRFEKRVELRIYSGELSDLNYGEFTFTSGPPAPTNLTLLTDLAITTAIAQTSVGGYDSRLIEDTNMTRYKIDGEKAAAFVYVLDSRDTVTESKPVVAQEQVIAIHKGKAYIFSFLARPSNFDSPTLTAIRQHMFNSIRWR